MTLETSTATRNRFHAMMGLPVAILLTASIVSAEPSDGRNDQLASVESYLKRHCYSCHDQREARAGFRVDKLDTDFLVAGVPDKWLEVMNQLNLGTMPPEDQARPDPDRTFNVVKWIATELQRAEKATRLAGGQTPMRRLNRDEYANTIRDLLKLDEKLLAPIIEDLPGDGKSEGFDRLGVALFFDQTQIERSLAAAEMISQLAIVDPIDEPLTASTRFDAEAEREGGMGIRPPQATERNPFVTEDKLEVAAGAPYHESSKDGVTFVQGRETYQKGNPLGRMATVTIDDLITADGYYRIRVRCGADRGTRDEPMRLVIAYNFKTPQEKFAEVDVQASVDDPDVVETVMFLRRGADDQRRKITLLYNDLRKYIVSTPEFNQLRQDTVGTVGKIQKARLAGDREEVARLETFLKDARKRAAVWKGPVRHIHPDFAAIRPPRFYLDWMELEGPLHDQWPPASHKRLLFDGDDRNDLGYATEIVRRFLPRAYRRPVRDDEVDRIVQLIASEYQSSGNFHAALRIGLQRILTSPGFLFLQEPDRRLPGRESADGPRRLTDHELASRLSYFLWSSMPDDELLRRADQGGLHEPGVLSTQVQRMLDDPKASQFVRNFSGQWLNVREFGSVMPATEYRDYDAELEDATKLEAYAFFAEVLRENLPISTFLDSDFVMVNERLARHYGIDGVTGDDIRRVAISPQHHRGGVLGMAGLMTLLSDGTRTLPVRRASWIVTQLFNDPPPPPPPNAGEVQPNTSGEKLTVRERLELHRDEPTCASCHRTLDPYGLALENYDAIGMWRERQNGEGIRGKKAPVLEVGGTLPGGTTFDSLEAFKAALLEETDRFARAFSARMLTYALCRPVGFADQGTIDELMAQLKSNDYRIQSLLHGVVASEAFHTK